MITRNYKEINWYEMNAMIYNDPLYSEIYFSHDINYISEGIIKVVNSNLEKTAPLKLIQLNIKNSIR